jgi:hypothetical protein
MNLFKRGYYSIRNNLKKSKARAQSQQDLADLDIINKNERDELAAN